MGGRLPSLNLDSSGFHNAANIRVRAAEIEAGGKEKLGAGIQRGLLMLGQGIANKRQRARDEDLREKTWARQDTIRGEENAREDARDARHEQARRDSLAMDIIGGNLRASETKQSELETVAAGLDPASPEATQVAEQLAKIAKETEDWRNSQKTVLMRLTTFQREQQQAAAATAKAGLGAAPRTGT